MMLTVGRLELGHQTCVAKILRHLVHHQSFSKFWDKGKIGDQSAVFWLMRISVWLLQNRCYNDFLLRIWQMACRQWDIAHHPNERQNDVDHLLPLILIQPMTLLITVHNKFIHCVSKNSQNCFHHNFVKFQPTLTTFGTGMVKTIELCKVYSFPTSPNLCQRTTM